jgi:hypothetical protein
MYVCISILIYNHGLCISTDTDANGDGDTHGDGDAHGDCRA